MALAAGIASRADAATDIQADQESGRNGFLLPINGTLATLPGTAGEPQPLTTIAEALPERISPQTDSAQLALSPITVMPPVLPHGTAAETQGHHPQPVLIDNDLELTEMDAEEIVRWEEIPDSPGKTKINVGARFPVVVATAHTSKTSRTGDPVEGCLKIDLRIGGRLVGKKGDLVRGHITSAHKARRILHAELSRKRWMRANGAIGLQFDEIITADGQHLPLVAVPARNSRIVRNKNEGRVLGVNHSGQIVSPLSTQLKHQAAHLAIRGAASAAGVFSMGIVPVAYGVVGAMNPSFAFLHPVGKNVPHRRLKGFTMGVVSGLPGGFLIADTIIKGEESVIKPGDEFLAEFTQEFTGQASTNAELMPGASTSVRGEVMKQGK